MLMRCGKMQDQNLKESDFLDYNRTGRVSRLQTEVGNNPAALTALRVLSFYQIPCQL